MKSSMNPEHPANQQVIRYLRRNGRQAALIAAADSIPDPYMEAGSHPEIVERVWNGLGAKFPRDARCLFCGTPALIHPRTGVVLALGLGTRYGLRIPPDCTEAAIRAGAKTFTDWTTGGSMNTREDLGEDWIFGAWLADEVQWCRAAYALYGRED